MKQTTKEQVTVTLLVDLEYETQDDREFLIQKITDHWTRLGFNFSGCRWLVASGSVTVSSNDESTIRAWRVQYRDGEPCIIRTTSGFRAQCILKRFLNIDSDDMLDVESERAPSFDWNSNLLAGDVYSLEHAEAGNKK